MFINLNNQNIRILGNKYRLLLNCVLVTKLQGLVVTHVHDLLYAGTAKFQGEIITGIRQKFKISRIYAVVYGMLNKSQTG